MKCFSVTSKNERNRLYLGRRERMRGFRLDQQKMLALNPAHRAARSPAVAGKHKLDANKFGKAPTVRLAHAAMLSANRPPGAQRSNAWKQTSYPALGSAMLGAFQAFVRTAEHLQAEIGRCQRTSTVSSSRSISGQRTARPTGARCCVW
jgi:hypothetical protein